MDYIKKTYTDKAVEVQISSFAGKGGVTEYHVLLAITDRTLPFSGQLQNIYGPMWQLSKRCYLTMRLPSSGAIS